MRILVADEDPLFRALLRIDLRKMHSLYVREACDGISALQKARLFNPDLVIVDAQLNLISGAQFIDALDREIGMRFIAVVLSPCPPTTQKPLWIKENRLIIPRHGLWFFLPDIIRGIDLFCSLAKN